MSATGFSDSNGINKTTLQYRSNSGWSNAKVDAEVGTFDFGPLDFRVEEIDVNARKVKLSIISEGGFDRLYHHDGRYTIFDTEALPTKEYVGIIYDLYGNMIGSHRGSGRGNPWEVEGSTTIQTFNLTQGSNDYLQFRHFELQDWDDATIDFLYTRGNQTEGFIGFGKDSTHRTIISSNDTIVFDGNGVHEYFLASWYPEV